MTTNDTTGWVIEDASTPSDHPSYFSVRRHHDAPGASYPGWSSEPLFALRFARESDAREFAETMVAGEFRVGEASFPRPSEASTSGGAWVDPDDAPELTAERIKQADVYEGETLIRQGRPPSDAANYEECLACQ